MSIKDKSADEAHYIGHRKRLKEKFLGADPAAFDEYELLEILLFAAVPRRDVKPMAKELLKKFGNLKSLLHADHDKILEVKGINSSALVLIKLIREMANRSLRHDTLNKHAIASWSSLLEYLKFNMGHLKIEQFRVLFLNKKNYLIADEIMSNGTIDQTPVFPREVVKRALYHEAGAIILVHNHPSGSIKPSNADIDLTTEIVNACRTINVTVHDHVIIAGNEYFSFKTNMLL